MNIMVLHTTSYFSKVNRLHRILYKRITHLADFDKKTLKTNPLFTNTHSHIIIKSKQMFRKGMIKMDTSAEPRGIFLVIDNKSFYATVECTMRGLDPLTTPLVVMSEAENTNGGLVLASSPMAKKLYGISNVNRQRDLPRDNHLIVVPPRMNTYIEKNIEVNNIYREFVADEDLLPYSID